MARPRDDVDAAEIRSWPHLPGPELVERISDVVSELFGLYQEAAIVEQDERTTKARAFASDPESSVTVRDRTATGAALPATLQLVELRGRIAALEAAREFGYLLVYQSS